MTVLRVSGRSTFPLAELLDLLQREIIARQVQQTVEQGGAVPGGKDEAVAIGPLRVARVVAQVLDPERVGHRRGPHGQAGVSRTRGFDRIDRKDAQGGYRLLLESFRLDGAHARPPSLSPGILDTELARDSGCGAESPESDACQTDYRDPVTTRSTGISVRLELWPGLVRALGSIYVFAWLTAIVASPKPATINFTFPG